MDDGGLWSLESQFWLGFVLSLCLVIANGFRGFFGLFCLLVFAPPTTWTFGGVGASDGCGAEASGEQVGDASVGWHVLVGPWLHSGQGFELCGLGTFSRAFCFVSVLSGFVKCFVIWGSEVSQCTVDKVFRVGQFWPQSRGAVAGVSNCRLWRLFMCLAMLCRVGEASLPGPSENFRLGACNPGGLLHKASLFAMQEADLWVVSETHLTRNGLEQFRAELQALRSPFRWTVHGHPVLPRSQVSEVGKWAGMAVVSKCPSRALVHHWDPAQYATGRLVAATSFCRGLWISGIGVYGTPVGPTHPRAKATTEHLLELAVARIHQAVGCRYVAGDWNHDHNDLQAVRKLKMMGFVDIQDLHFRTCGVFPRPTCRGKTRRDYFYVSPELVQRFVSCQVDPLAWTDHASIVGEFRADLDFDLKYIWPIPSKLDWPEHSCLPFVDFESSPDLDFTYRHFWKQREDAALAEARKKGVSVIPGSTGRGLHLHPKKCVVSNAPVRKGRVGEQQPVFLGHSLMHAHWFKQLRRLQCFARLASVVSPTDNHVRHAQELWDSIVKAPGFQPTFRDWWNLTIVPVGVAPQLSFLPPGGDVAWTLFSSFQVEVTKLERALIKHKNYAARLKRTGDIAHLYRRVRRDAPDQVDVLFHEVSNTVTEVDHLDHAVEFSASCPWKPESPVFHRGRQINVHHAENDKLWLEDIQGVEVGDLVVQPQSAGSLQELFKAFAEQWKTRWIRHSHVPAERWEVIIAFAEQHLRPVEAPELALTPSLLRAVIHRKKRLAATGLDGVSRRDLIALDSNGIASLLSLYRKAGTTGCWPQQVLNGAVKSLAKKVAPATPDHFRPVTVFSMVYRCWSSAESRYWLTQLDQVLHPMLHGNRKGRRAADVWRCMLDHLEESSINDHIASGLILDLEKAFNTLPRKPTLAAVRLLGLPFSVIRSWAGALGAMSRHFAIRGSYSPGLMSDCGFPEGCGLSCLAMVAIDQLFHCWVDKSQELASAVTYVDNWELLIMDPQAIQSSFDRVLEFASLLDLTVDEKKTIAWSNDPLVRKDFRHRGFRVDLAVRELGAQLTFTQQIRNSTLLDRVHALQDFWLKLRAAGGTFAQKIRLIFTGAWPRAFHGVSACFVGRKHWVKVRSEFLRAVGLEKPGSNAWLQMAQERTGFDPQAFAVLQTFRDYRDFGNTEVHRHRLDLAHGGLVELPPGSVSEILLARLHSVGWTWTGTQKVHDGHSIFSLGHVGWKELECRFDRSWGLVVAKQIAHRADFSHFDKVDLYGTRRALSVLSPHERAILRPCLNGSMFTLDHAFRWSDTGQDVCPKCNAADSAYHRLWCCPWTENLRASLHEQVVSLVPTLPQVLTVHGWSLTPCTRDQWWSYLHGLSWQAIPACAIPSHPVCDIFTDGSCWWPAEDFRIASWSVILADNPHVDCDAWSTHVLSSGPLPGIVQSAHRAELFALLSAVELTQNYTGVVRVWSDCLSVVHGFHNFVVGGVPIPPNHKHSDLWQKLVDSVHRFSESRILVGKVPAHAELCTATSDIEQWAFVGNRAADHAAAIANWNRGTEFWQLWLEHATAVVNFAYVSNSIREHMVRVSEQWEACAIPEVVLATPMHRRSRQFVLEWEPHAEIKECVGKFRQCFHTIADEFLAWWHSGVNCPDSPVRWVSFCQLYIDWQLQTGHPGMLKSHNRWVDPLVVQGCTPEMYQFKLRSKWWRLTIQQFIKDHGIKTRWINGRPASTMLQCFLGCISLPWSNQRLIAVDDWLRLHLRSPALGQGQALEVLPLFSQG